MLRTAVVFSIALFALALVAGPADAFPQFQKEFVKKYAADKESDYGKLVKEAKCYSCHQGKSKRNKNAYGKALDEFLTKDDKRDKDKINEALDKVAEMPSVEGDDESPTFGALIAEGKLPGGTLEECKEEPADEE